MHRTASGEEIVGTVDHTPANRHGSVFTHIIFGLSVRADPSGRYGSIGVDPVPGIVDQIPSCLLQSCSVDIAVIQLTCLIFVESGHHLSVFRIHIKVFTVDNPPSGSRFSVFIPVVVTGNQLPAVIGFHYRSFLYITDITDTVPDLESFLCNSVFVQTVGFSVYLLDADLCLIAEAVCLQIIPCAVDLVPAFFLYRSDTFVCFYPETLFYLLPAADTGIDGSVGSHIKPCRPIFRIVDPCIFHHASQIIFFRTLTHVLEEVCTCLQCGFSRCRITGRCLFYFYGSCNQIPLLVEPVCFSIDHIRAIRSVCLLIQLQHPFCIVIHRNLFPLWFYGLFRYIGQQILFQNFLYILGYILGYLLTCNRLFAGLSVYCGC